MLLRTFHFMHYDFAVLRVAKPYYAVHHLSQKSFASPVKRDHRS